MPKVQTYDNLQATPTVMANTRMNNAVSADMMSMPGRQMQQMGQAARQAAGDYAKIQIDAQKEANSLRVQQGEDDARKAIIQLTYDKDAGYTNLRGVDALSRPDGKSLDESYTEQLSRHIDTISAGLGNDAQREAFKARAAQLVTQFQGNVTQHVGEQFRNYAMSVRDGTIQTRVNEIGLNYNKPDFIGPAVEDIHAAALDLARMKGLSAVEAEAEARKLTSAAHRSAIAAAIQNNNPVYADDYLKKFSSGMTADDILAVNGVLTKQLDATLASQAVQKVFSDVGPKINTSDADRAFNILVGTESSNRQFGPDGQTLTSPKGALGIAQVMPATAKEIVTQIMRVKWTPEVEQLYKNDAEFNRQLGQRYFEKQLQSFGGSLAKAYAAYNAGPGATQGAIDRAAKEGGDFLAYLPKETQDYVAKNMAEFQQGGGQYKRPTLLEVKSQVRASVGDSNPERLSTALQLAEQTYNDQTKAIEQRKDEAVATAMRTLLEQGGSYASLPPEVRNAVPPDKVGSIIDFASKLSKGDDSTNLKLYNRLTIDHAYLTSLTDDQLLALRGELSQADFKHFSEERAKLLNGTAAGGNSPGDLNTAAINSTLEDRLHTLGIATTGKSANQMRLGAIRKFVNQSVLSAQAAAGKRMNDADVDKLINQLFSRNSTYSGFFGDTSGPMLGMMPAFIPSAQKEAIIEVYKRRGIDNPTDADLLQAYWIGMMAAKPAPRSAE